MTVSAPAKPHLSPSQIDSYTRCGEAYRRRYIEKEIIPPGFSLIKGGSVHKGAEENFRQKIETKADIAVNDMAEIAAAHFDGTIRLEGVLLSEEEESIGKAKVIGNAKDSAIRMVGTFAASVAPLYQPIAVEEKVRIALPGPRDLLGVMDLVLEDGVQDLKTGAKKKTQSDIDTSAQLTTYAALYQAKYGKPPARLIIDTVIDRVSEKTAKVTSEHQQLTTTRDANDFNALAARINTVVKGIEAGSFIPATPGAWWCSAKSCGYWRTCAFVNSERKAAADAE